MLHLFTVLFVVWIALELTCERTNLVNSTGNEMVRVGTGFNEGRWFFRIDLWSFGWRWTHR